MSADKIGRFCRSSDIPFRPNQRKTTRNSESAAKALTKYPEDETDLNLGDELIDWSERFFEQRVDLLSPQLLIGGVQRRAEYLAGGRAVGGYGARLTLEAERGQCEQDQEADV